eukprot:4630890-Amphidinium_carterae.1
MRVRDGVLGEADEAAAADEASSSKTQCVAVPDEKPVPPQPPRRATGRRPTQLRVVAIAPWDAEPRDAGIADAEMPMRAGSHCDPATGSIASGCAERRGAQNVWKIGAWWWGV